MRELLNKLLFLASVIGFFSTFSYGQKSDDQLLQTTTLQSEIRHEHKLPGYLFENHPSNLVKYNPVSLVFGSALWFYQAVISPQFNATCIYSPSCSSFSKELIRHYGLIPGIVYSADRLSRCNKLTWYDYSRDNRKPDNQKIRETVNYYILKHE